MFFYYYCVNRKLAYFIFISYILFLININVSVIVNINNNNNNNVILYYVLQYIIMY